MINRNRVFKFIKISMFLFIISSTTNAQSKNLRIVSLSPSLTELIFHLNEESKLVGRTSACDYPKKVKKIETVGGFGKPSLEKLITLRPDIVISSALANPAMQKSIEQFKIKFVLLPTKSIDDYYKTVQHLGDILNCPQKATAEIARVKNGLAKFVKLNKSKSRPTIYMEIWNHPYMTFGKKSFINDLINYAGGENIANSQDKDYFNCSLEWIITQNPDIIIAPAMKKGSEIDIKKRNGWHNINAIKNNKVYVAVNSSILYRLGPRVLEGVKLLHSIINKK